MSGVFRAMERGHKMRMMATGRDYEVKEVGGVHAGQTPRERLKPGDVGYIIANVKSTAESKSATRLRTPATRSKEPLPGFKEIHPMVFCGIYPVSTEDFEQLKLAIGKLQINDAALTYMAESSAALGFGFRCGFLGLLHMEIVQERLRREFNMDVISTYPGVVYEVTKRMARR